VGGGAGVLGLLFNISADPAEAQEALESFQGKVEAVTGAASGSFGGLNSILTSGIGAFSLYTGAITAVSGALFEFADKEAKVGESIHHATEVTGLSAAALSGLRAESQHTGESFDSLTTSLGRATRNIAQTADTGKGALTSLFTETQLQSLQLLPVDERLHAVLQRIFALTDEGERNRQLQALLGRGWQTNIETLKALAAQGFDPLIQKAKDLHQFYDEQRVEEAHQFDLAWNDLKATFAGLSDQIGAALVPAFTHLFESISHGSPELAEMSQRAQQFQQDLDKYGVALDLNGQMVTKDEAAKRKAKQTEDEWHDSSARSVDAIKAQVAGLKIAVPAWASSLKIVGEHKVATDEDTESVKKQKTAIEELADKSHKFWQEYNAGLTEGSDKIPTFLTEMQQLEKTVDDVVKEAISEGWRRFTAFLSGDFKAVGLSAGSFSITDPFGPFATSVMKAVPPLHNLNQAADQYYKTLLKIPPLQATWTSDNDKFLVTSARWIQQVGLMKEALQLWENTGKQAFTSIGNAMGTAAANAIVYGKNFGAAMEQALKSTLTSIAGQAFGYAIMATGMGFYDLARQDYADAALNFEAAAIFGSIGGAAAGIGAAIPGGGAGGAGGSGRGPGGVPANYNSGTITPRGPGGVSGGGGVQVVMNIDGLVSADTLEEIAPAMADALSSAVQSGQGQLYATTTVRRPNATQGG
jgi:hypothetical protein